jgi:hypothetical protein
MTASRQHLRRFGLRVAALPLVALAFVGCGDGRPSVVPVQGRILIDGQPLTHGAIRVVPENARAATAQIQPDGTFRLTTFKENDGCVRGKHAVEVVGYELLNKGTIRKWHAPTRYGDQLTSGLSLEVDEPANDVELELTWGKEKPFTENLLSGVKAGTVPAQDTF